MAQELTQAQATGIQTMMANVETAYRQVNAARTSLSQLIIAGQATCRDIQTYNLQVKAVYAYQASVAHICKANGTQGVPNVPAPIYVVWKGIAGDQAANIDCATAQLRGGTPVVPGIVRVNPTQVEWRQEALPSDNALVSQVVAAAGNNAVAAGRAAGLSGQLGIAPLVVVAIIIIGVLVAVVATILLRVVEALMDIPGKVETTKQVAIQAEQHRINLEQRAACYTDCTARGKDPTECAKSCDRLNPEFKPTFPGGGWGIFGTIAAVSVLGVLGYAGYRYVKSGSVGRAIRSGAQPDELDGVDTENAIDVEYTEHAA